MNEINNDDIVKLYEDVISHIKYLNSNIMEEETEEKQETSEENE
jgi:hypothetical protein